LTTEPTDYVALISANSSSLPLRGVR